MIRCYYLPEYAQVKLESYDPDFDFKNVTWIDLHSPTREEIKKIEEKFGIDFPTRQEQEEIESSSRYIEENGNIIINSTFISYNPVEKELDENEISFIVTKNHLFTLRFFESRVLQETVKKIKQAPNLYNSPIKILITILQTRIDYDADLIEALSRSIAILSRKINYNRELDESNIIKINEFQEHIMSLREALFDKQRVLSALLKNEFITNEYNENLRGLLKDINSLIEHTNFNFTRLEYLQNSFLGLINIEQNKIIKLFTVASVLFMPPTLIASIYGMNFKYMPELEWLFGYPFAILLMLFSVLIALFFFKKKGWL